MEGDTTNESLLEESTQSVNHCTGSKCKNDDSM